MKDSTERSKAITVIDCTNFWSPSGGGVRRYHLEKLADYRRHQGFRLVFVMHDARTWTETVAENVQIEHIAVGKIRPRLEYRILFRSSPLAELFRKYRPNVVEIGSPYLMPMLVARGLRQAGCDNARTFGFWHADYPVTYGRRLAASVHPFLAKLVEALAWYHARRQFNSMHGLFCACRSTMAHLAANGVKGGLYLPLGVDAELFHPARRSEAFRAAILGTERQHGKILFFPHRLDDEKGVRTLLSAFARIIAGNTEPIALVFAGTGPLLPLVKEAVARNPGRIHYRGFVSSVEEMAMLHASSDVGLALSPWETFGLSMLESMAAGRAQVAADGGAAAEHITDSGAGLAIDATNSAALAAAILRVLRSPSLPQYEQQARRYALQFTWENCFARQRLYYRRCVEGKPLEGD